MAIKRKLTPEPIGTTSSVTRVTSESAAPKATETIPVSSSGAIPAVLTTNAAQALSELPSHTYAAKIRPQDRSSKRLRLNSPKQKIARKLEEQFKTPSDVSNNSKYNTKTKIINSAFIHGPSGSFPSDVFLDRALKNLEKEKANSTTKEGASNIVILGRRKSSCERMARRLLKIADPKTRSDLEKRIEVLDSYKIEAQSQGTTPDSPRIIFIPSESLTTVVSKKGDLEKSSATSRVEINVKRDLTQLVRHIGLDRLKYLYFDHAHTMTSTGKSLIFDYLKKNMDARVGTGFQEIIGSSFCAKYHVDSNDEDHAASLDEKERRGDCGREYER